MTTAAIVAADAPQRQLGARASAGAAGLPGFDYVIGRDHELAEVESCVRRAAAGARSFLFLHGEPGIGKSTLLRHAAKSAARFGLETTEVSGAGAMGAAVAALRADRPRLVLLDDAHAVDARSLHHLVDVVDSLPPAIGIMLAHRQPSRRLGRALGRLHAALMRRAQGTGLRLRGFDVPDVKLLVHAVSGVPPATHVIRDLRDRTDGNPFLIAELARAWLRHDPFLLGAAALSGDVLPPAIGASVDEFLDALSDDARAALTVGVVVGREFALDVVAAVTGLPPARLVALMQDLVHGGYIEPLSAGTRGFRFRHAVVHDHLYAAIPLARRLALHAALAGRIDSAQTVRPQRIALLARHCHRAGPLVEAGRSFAVAMDAARLAERSRDYKEAARHFAAAVDVMEEAGLDPARQCDVLLAAGHGHARSGLPEQSVAYFDRAAELARDLGDGVRLAEASLGVSGPLIPFGFVNHRAVELLELALAELPEGQDALRARLLMRLALETRYESPPEVRRAVAEQALAIARRIGDARTIAVACGERRDREWLTLSIDAYAADVTEALAHAEQTGDPAAILDALAWHVLLLIERAEFPEVHRAIERFERIADGLRDPLYEHRAIGYRVMVALLEGRFDAAEQLAIDFVAVAKRVSERQALMACAGHVATMRRFRGRPEDTLAGVDALLTACPTLWIARAGHTLLLAELGRVTEAREALEQIAVRDFQAVPVDHLWVGAMTFLAEACAVLGEKRHAATLYDLLAPYRTRTIVMGMGGCWGSAARVLGRLAATLGRDEVADRHFEYALHMNRRLNARPYVALTQLDYAKALLDRGLGFDDPRVAGLLDAARTMATALGMDALMLKVDALARAECPPAIDVTPITNGNGAPTDQIPMVVRAAGGGWVIGDAGGPVSVPGSIGMRYLAALLLAPGEDRLALDLAVRCGTMPESVTHDARAITLLDGTARRRYRARLEALGERLADAEADGDEGRAAACRAEIDALGSEVARAFGLGGRARRGGDPVERARQNVTRAIRRAIDTLRTIEPELAEHLDRSIHTGTFCRYDPGASSRFVWTSDA